MPFVARSMIVFLFFAALMASGAAAEPSREEQIARIEKAITAGASFLVKQQDTDGAWRSKRYGLLKDGTSLTPLVLSALPGSSDCEPARESGLRVLSTWVNTKSQVIHLGAIPQYPVYTAGLCIEILMADMSEERRIEAMSWRKSLMSHQLNQQNGWSSDDLQFGGWGYSHERPVKSDPGATLSPLDEPNLSATVFALEGLAAMDREATVNTRMRRMALKFVERCQNYREATSPNDAKFNDGGFHFILQDAVRNKPGIAGTDSRGETRFVSYGSATADGLRCLVLCGAEPTHPRVHAARRWLVEHFDDGSHPGAYPTDRSSLKPSLDFYYAASVARAFQLAPMGNDQALGRGEWAMRLANRLLSRQRIDGSWSNPAVDVREDDPLVATPFALRTLQLCRDDLQRRAIHTP
jgi:hypothetical protein